jgi:hypothetical protein
VSVEATRVKAALLILGLLALSSAGSFAQPKPAKYYERLDRDAFVAVTLYPDGKAHFLSVSHRPGKPAWFYSDNSATWGTHESRGPYVKRMKDAPLIWVQTYDRDGSKRYRHDYYQTPRQLVEYDKMGLQPPLTQQVNMADDLKH